MKPVSLLLGIALCMLLCSCGQKSEVSEKLCSMTEGTTITEATTTVPTVTSTATEPPSTSAEVSTAVQTVITTPPPSQPKKPFVDLSRAKLLNFSGLFDYDDEYLDIQTLDTSIIEKIVGALNDIEYLSLRESSAEGNWRGGLWDINIFSDGVLCYAIHSEDDMLFIGDGVDRSKRAWIVLTLKESARRSFEEKVLDFSAPAWTEYIDSTRAFLDEIEQIETFSGTSIHAVLVATEDFSQYQEIEKKYLRKHDFKAFQYQTVPFSLRELEQTCNNLEEKGHRYSVYKAMPNRDGNSVRVYMTVGTEENTQAIRALLSPITSIEFIVSDDYLPRENPKTS